MASWTSRIQLGKRYITCSQSAGNYYIKVVDGAVGSSVAVTDTFLTITAPPFDNSILNVSPSQGAGGTPITFTGSGWPSKLNQLIFIIMTLVMDGSY